MPVDTVEFVMAVDVAAPAEEAFVVAIGAAVLLHFVPLGWVSLASVRSEVSVSEFTQSPFDSLLVSF